LRIGLRNEEQQEMIQRSDLYLAKTHPEAQIFVGNT
jgi:hypothetical protein